MSERSYAGEAAALLLTRLAGLGLRDIVVAPGSRSQGLALAAAALERAGAVRVHVRTDERVAGFTALGLAIETGRPVAVVVTSGTAVAELHPAVLEARHAGVPLLLLTADRPAELRGTGANQTTVQPGIFGPAAVRVLDVAAPASDADVAAAVGVAEQAWTAAVEAPVQVNLCYREPLSAPPAAPGLLAARGPLAAAAATMPGNAEPVAIEPGPRTVVIAGDRAGEAAEAFARALHVPLLAEVSSGARFGTQLVPCYRRLLDDADFGGRVQRAVVFGHPTLSRQVPQLLARPDVDTVLVRPPGGMWFDPTGGRAMRTGAVAATNTGDTSWTTRWVAAGPARPAGETASITHRSLASAVWHATEAEDRLVLGASRLIREADAAVPGRRIRVIANRGLAGIDGTVSTATGVALGHGAGTTRVLLGDLTLLHDAGALLAAPGEALPRLQVIVGDDGGGTIFDTLEVAGTADPADFARMLRTPRRVDWAALAAAYGWPHRRVDTGEQLRRALTGTGRGLIEVPLPRT